MVRSSLTPEWKHSMVAALLADGEAAADHLELAAAEFEKNPQTRGIANILRDRAEDIRRAKARDPQGKE